MQLHSVHNTTETMAGSFVIIGATILCWTTVMGAAAAYGAGHTLLDGITAAAVVALGCVGGMGMVRTKKRTQTAQQAAKQAALAPRDAAQPKPPAAAPGFAENLAADASNVAENADACLPSATERACRVLAQAHDLSLRERDVLDLMATGMTGKEIATELTLSYNTVKSHIRHIYAKLDVHRKQDLADLIDHQQQLLEQQRIA